MCGISVVMGQRVRRSVLQRMNAAQAHRGPDSDDVWMGRDQQIGLGHRRLSVVDLSEDGSQPMEDSSGRYVIAFNGEIYNYLELRELLGGRACFRTKTDTEVLLAAYRKWGAACLDRLIGMFAFVVWDKWEKQLFAARDRFGVKPLYYSRLPSGDLLMASEIKGLFAGGVIREPNRSVWAGYLS